MPRLARLNLLLSDTHSKALAAKAEDAQMPLDAYVQRLLQSHVDSKLPIPHPYQRQVATLSARLLGVSESLDKASRALEQGDARSPPLQADLTGALTDVREAIRAAGEYLKKSAA